ncbi:MAG: hypothetical protein ACREDL_17380 [Bradyrhizobium sp.]
MRRGMGSGILAVARAIVGYLVAVDRGREIDAVDTGALGDEPGLAELSGVRGTIVGVTQLG